MKKRLFIIIFIVLNFGFLYSQSLTGEMIDNIKRATVYIEVKHRFPLTDEEVPTSGTGFFISKYGHVITNYHVIQPVLTIYGLTFPAPVSTIRIIQNSGSKDHKVLYASLLAIDKDNDIAILNTKDTVETPYLNIDCKGKIFETMPIWVFGYPFGDAFSVIQRGPEVTVSKGSLSALRHDDRGELTKVQIDAAVNPGNSGGPVINEKGNVIGIVKLAYGTSRVNFVVPCHFVTTLLEPLSLETGGDDSTTLEITSNPPDAFVFLDWQRKIVKPSQKITTSRGLHSIIFIKQGYETWIEEQTIDSIQNITVSLQPARNLPLSPTKREKEDKPKQVKGVYDTGNVLFKEDFNDEETFEQWEQYTGGTDKRTWFIENSILNQFESNEVLHAIYLGDTTWDNYIVKAKVKISDEHDDSRAGLIFRETADGFYLFRIHKETDKAQLAYHCKRPFGWFIIMEKKLDLDISDAWYTMVVSVVDNAIACFLDSLCVFTAQTEHARQGRIGFYSVESKASFDSLVVCHTKSDALKLSQSYKPELLSFWFSDYFNLKSTWWYQYTAKDKLPAPWFFCDGGCAYIYNDKKTRYSEFTKYQLADFTMNFLVSLGKGNKNSFFEIFFRKNSTGYTALQFSKKEKKCKLVVIRGRNTKVLKKIALPSDIFNNTLQLRLVVNKEEIVCNVSDRTLIEHQSKVFPQDLGTFGFAVSQVPVVLHQITVSSVKEKGQSVVSKKGKKRKRKRKR